MIIGIDPGKNMGVATFMYGSLISLQTLTPMQILKLNLGSGKSVVIVEDSRSKSYAWNARKHEGGTALKIARDLGRIDAYCELIEQLVLSHGGEFIGISPTQKGRKLNAEEFKKVTGWTGRRTNQHERDAAMVAWGFRGKK